MKQTIGRRDFVKTLGMGIPAGYLPIGTVYGDYSKDDVEFLQRDSAVFDLYRRLFNKRIDFLPRIIALCKNEKGVQQAVHYANTHSLDINIKSGGHSFEGFSLNNDGLVIDVSLMSGLELRADNRLIAGPGVRLVQLYSYCLPKGRLLPSGSCATVGLSGITLGGGYGLFAREFGLTCDHLKGVRLIDAKGIAVDSDEVPELLWACRGGGNGNFGVITEMRFDTVPAPTTLYQHRFRSYKLSPRAAADLARFWFDQCELLPDHAFSAFVLNRNTLTVMLTSTDHDRVMTRILSKFDQRMDENAQLKPDPLEVGIQYYYGRSNAMYFKNFSAGYYSGFNDISRSIEEIFTLVGKTPGAVFQINTLGGEISRLHQENEGAYVHRDANYLGEAQCYWEKPADEVQRLESMAHLQELLHKSGITKHYVNYPDINIKNYENAYYGDSYDRLQRLKSILDPGNRFNYPQSIERA
ncbi:FAD-binding oxidoreductase [Microbulbifer variabilis]|uniref:FAD-binding oxidoreductase n=1 Tax=Microbulbifer variabilis TaxID=266805 RepID=UPI000379D250|nr:FAD-binding oxidoreductase [Microbulbifer variabilis]